MSHTEENQSAVATLKLVEKSLSEWCDKREWTYVHGVLEVVRDSLGSLDSVGGHAHTLITSSSLSERMAAAEAIQRVKAARESERRQVHGDLREALLEAHHLLAVLAVSDRVEPLGSHRDRAKNCGEMIDSIIVEMRSSSTQVAVPPAVDWEWVRSDLNDALALLRAHNTLTPEQVRKVIEDLESIEVSIRE